VSRPSLDARIAQAVAAERAAIVAYLRWQSVDEVLCAHVAQGTHAVPEVLARVELAETARRRRLADEAEASAQLLTLTAGDLEPTGELPMPETP
jgi:hypothetical protein